MVSHLKARPARRGHGQPDRAARCAGYTSPEGAADSATTLARYLRAVSKLVRGPVGVAVIVGVLSVAGAVGGRAGLAIAGTYLVFLGSYCVLNFWHCRETHCVVTGPGWMAVGIVGWVAAATGAGALSWYTVNAVSLATIGVFVVGYGLEWTLASVSGRRRLG